MDTLSLYTKNVGKQIRNEIHNSSMIYILSSFMMRSGIDLIYDDLQYALDNGADIKILTGDYLYITQPEALEKLTLLDGESVEIRLWKSDGISFHPKSFIFKHREDGAIIVGSSNLSKSALTNGTEWNLRMARKASPKVFNDAIDSFIKLFYDEKTAVINQETITYYKNAYNAFHAKHTRLIEAWTKQEEIELTLPIEQEDYSPELFKETSIYEPNIKPRPAQEEALEALKDTVEEGYSKAMVIMATGLGKTYLAAFFAKKYHKILFIAHREEILKQAKASFEKVLDKKGGLYYGVEKDKNNDMIFASIFTLSIQDHLKNFSKDEFDLIIIDEFHHAAAKSYSRILAYFEPKFLLGLTATPQRTDGKDIFALCDGNVAYEITFPEAIQRGWLAPFIYYGIKDDIDYSQIRWLGQRYDQKELIVQQVNRSRAKYIYGKWKYYRQNRTLAFCSSIEQATFLSDYFFEKGISSISLTSETKTISRQEAINKLENGGIDIIFTVDLFNEGVDIPSVDTLLFVRPTESMVVFTQQLGRGLRKYSTKEHCVIIDLIGNYRNADTKLQVFGEGIVEAVGKNDFIAEVPDNCEINLETEVIDLIKELQNKRSSRKDKIYEDYRRVKDLLGRRPTYREVHLHGKENSKEYRQAFGGYFAFLYQTDELDENETRVYERYQNWFKRVEKELMTKSYKMVVLQYMLSKGPAEWSREVTPEEVAPYFHQFFMEKEYRKRIDFSNKNTRKLWEYDKEGVANLIAKMPMSKWVSKKDNLISFNNNIFKINLQVNEEDERILHQITLQICEYKLQVYFERKGYGQ